MRRSAHLALAALVALPAAQAALEAAVSFPVGPTRMLTLGACLLALVPLAREALERLAGGPVGAGTYALLAGLVPALALAHVLAGARLLDGPFGPLPGGPLHGETAPPGPVDWRPVADTRYAELEVHPERPRSLETLVLVHEGALYVAANMPEGKRWPSEVRRDGRVRVRVGGGPVHARRAVRVEDPARTARLLDAMNAKYGFDVSLGGPIWFFRLEPRRGAP